MMHYLISSRPLLLIVALACLARCETETSPWQFPHVSDPEIPNISNLTIHINDSIIVEYTKLSYATVIGLDVSCSNSAQNAIGNENSNGGYGPGQTFNNTGKVIWDFSQNPDLIYSIPCEEIEPGNPCPPADLTYCQFMLYNASVDSCSWGPWGIGTWVNSRNFSYPLSYGPVFRVLPGTNHTKPTLWINAADKTASSLPASITATATVNVTCPPSGIPASTTMIATYQTDIWPPIASNLTFPVWSLPDEESENDGE